MEDVFYKGMWYRVLQHAPKQWRYVVRDAPGAQPIQSAVIDGDAAAAVAMAKSWIDLLKRNET